MLTPEYYSIDKETLRRMYYDEQMSTTQIARILGVRKEAISYWMRHLGFELRSRSEAARMRADRNGTVGRYELTPQMYGEGI